MRNFIGGDIKTSNKMCAFMLLAWSSFILLLGSRPVVAGDKGDDIILTKGKLILRGGKGKGNLILDTGTKSSEHYQPMPMPMMPMMGHHFNPYSFYPMAQQHHQSQAATPVVQIQPVYLEDQSSMHHHQLPQPMHHSYHHEEPPQHHFQVHEVEQHEMQPAQEQQQHMPMSEAQRYEGIHHQQQQHEPIEHQYEHESAGYESHPMMSAMMMHASGLQPTYEQLAALQALQHPALIAHHQSLEAQRAMENINHLGQQEKQNLDQTAKDQAKETSATSQAGNKHVSLLAQSANNPLVAMIRPLFKRNKNANENKKP